MAKREKIRKDLKILEAWIDKKMLKCRGLVEEMEINFTVAEIGVPDKNGKIAARNMDELKALLFSAQDKMKKGIS